MKNTIVSTVLWSSCNISPTCRKDSEPIASQSRGSSPLRKRGLREVIVTELVSRQFTPASAGNTIICARLSAIHTVHPRVCGEYSMYKFVFMFEKI